MGTLIGQDIGCRDHQDKVIERVGTLIHQDMSCREWVL